MNLGRERLLIIAPHPDDEVIGCGGLIQKVKQGGGKVFVLFVTNGDTNDFSKKGLSTEKERLKEIEKVSKFLGFDDYDIALSGNKYHLKLDTIGQLELMNIIERKSNVSVKNTLPTIITFPSPTSYNQDHRIVSVAAHAAARPAEKKSKHFIPSVLSYEQAAEGWTLHQKEIVNFSISLSKKEITKKLNALSLYSSQTRSFPNPRSNETLLTLARLRGSQCGCEYAESFTAYRIAL